MIQFHIKVLALILNVSWKKWLIPYKFCLEFCRWIFLL